MEPTIPTSILGLLLLLLLLLVVLPASLSAELLYTKVGNTITITGSNPKASGNLVIPATIENLPVTLIGEGAFTNCTSLTSVTIPNSVTTINRSAFANCNSLTTVTIPTSVTFLGSSSFSYCASLTNVTIPNTIPTLRYRTFYECNALTSITIPNNITAIGDEAFYGCNRLASVVIPNSVTSIGTNSFRNCIGLKSATIGTGVKSIGPLAFCYCTELSGVYFTGDAPAPAVDSFSNSGPTIFYLLGKTGWGTTFAGRPTSSSTAPSITSSSSAMATATLSFNFTISSNDPRATFYAIGMPPGLALNPTTGAITGIPTAIGTYCIILSANNAAGSGTQELTITIAPGPPVITSSVTATGTLGLPFSYTVVATFSPTRFEATGLPRGLAIDPNTGVIFGVPTMIGSEAVVLPAINATGKGTKTLNLNINPAPKVTATVGLWFSYKITANNSPTLFNATGLPSGFSLNPSSGVISGTPTTIGSYSVTLFASNAATTETQLINLIVNPPRPVITSPSSATATVGVPFAFTAKANNSPTLFEATGLPSGLAIHPTTGLISGIPTTKGTYTIYLSASNAGGMGNQALSLTVLPPRPVFTSSSVATARIGQVFRFTITANFSPTRFTATGLPVGLSLDTSTGVIFGVPSIIGTSTVTVSAINEGGTGTQTLTLTVAPPPSASASEGQPFSYLVQANNPAALFNATGLPSGLSINPTTGLISGVPTTVGTYTVTLFASSATGTEIQTLTLTIRPAWRLLLYDLGPNLLALTTSSWGEAPYVVEYTEDFKLWTPLATLLYPDAEYLSNLDPQASSRPFRFYRLKKP